jgi:hypothetical protein
VLDEIGSKKKFKKMIVMYDAINHNNVDVYVRLNYMRYNSNRHIDWRLRNPQNFRLPYNVSRRFNKSTVLKSSISPTTLNNVSRETPLNLTSEYG